MKRSKKFKTESEGTIYLYGKHAVLAAIANPKRSKIQLYCNEKTEKELDEVKNSEKLAKVTITDNRHLDQLAEGNRHQGFVLICKELQQPDISEIINKHNESCKVIIIDRLYDARNLGAVIRAAFLAGFNAVIVPKRHSPKESGSVAQAAAGALECCPLIQVGNIANTIRKLQSKQFTILALDNNENNDDPYKISTIPGDEKFYQPLALIVGSENKGLRDLTKSLTDKIITIQMLGITESVTDQNPYHPDSHNLAQATAIAMSIISASIIE